MALFDTRCTGCGDMQENVYHTSKEGPPPCGKCGAATEHVWLKRSPAVEIFPAGFFEHAQVDGAPIPHFESRQAYKNHLKQHGMYADLVEGR